MNIIFLKIYICRVQRAYETNIKIDDVIIMKKNKKEDETRLDWKF